MKYIEEKDNTTNRQLDSLSKFEKEREKVNHPRLVIKVGAI